MSSTLAQKLTHFGLDPIDDALLKRWAALTPHIALHPWLIRGIYFCHQGLNDILDAIQQKRQVYVYTGRGPSNTMHLGHCVPFMFAKYLQDAFDCPVVIQMADEEKYYFKQDLSKTQINEFLHKNIQDIIAFGFNPQKTFVFSSFEYYSLQMRSLQCELLKSININQLNKIYGFTETSTIGQLFWPIQQMLPAFSDTMPRHLFTNSSTASVHANDNKPLCIVPMGQDQAVYFRLARDHANRLGFPKPALICSSFLPCLDKISKDKMSSTGLSSQKTIFLDSDEKTISKLIKSAFCGGQATLELHRELGGNSTIDGACQLLKFFEFDNMTLKEIINKFEQGLLLTSEVKTIAIKCIVDFLSKHKFLRAQVTNEIVSRFMKS